MINLGIVEKYANYLPSLTVDPISLQEGNTPLILAKNLMKFLKVEDFCEIYLKIEGCNPTGSFKDRGMAFAISKVVESNTKTIICASTGNTAASAAAYAASANLKCFVIVPANNVAVGKLSQTLMYGAQLISIKGNFDQSLKMVIDITKNEDITLVNSINPHRISGQKTAAFEIVDALEDAPDFQFMPVGNAGNITAYWAGYKEYCDQGKSVNIPKIMGFQAANAAPIVHNKIISNPQTIATAIKIGNPASWKQAIQAKEQSGGVIDLVTDEEILEAYQLIAKLEGIFCEPASATSIAGLIKILKTTVYIKRPYRTKIVCILTGNGLKDTTQAAKQFNMPAPYTISEAIDVLQSQINKDA